MTIEPCRFCGSAECDFELIIRAKGTYGRFWHVRCHGCYAAGPAIRAQVREDDNNAQLKAAVAWNRGE